MLSSDLIISSSITGHAEGDILVIWQVSNLIWSSNGHVKHEFGWQKRYAEEKDAQVLKPLPCFFYSF